MDLKYFDFVKKIRSAAIQEEVDRLAALARELKEAGPVNEKNPLKTEGAAKAHRQASLKGASEAGRIKLKECYDSLGLDY